MLLESLVKATVELQGFRVVAVTGDAGGLVAELVPDLRFSPRCGQCGAPGQYRDTRRTRRFRHVPLWGIAVALRYAPRRVRCARCAGVHVESLPWVSGKQQMTRALMVVLATWARTLPWQQVARLFRCSWGTVATAVEEAVAYGLAQQDLADLTHIGVDEISRKRGHVYVTNVYDLAHRDRHDDEARGPRALRAARPLTIRRPPLAHPRGHRPMARGLVGGQNLCGVALCPRCRSPPGFNVIGRRGQANST